MSEQSAVTALATAAKTLKALALVALEEDDPMALPEPPEPEQVAEYEQLIAAISAVATPGHRALAAASLQDYKAGFADRAAIHLLDLSKLFLQEPAYTNTFPAAIRQQLQAAAADLSEL